ncbi:hypothetical protein [Thalassospira marina]|uniref:Uncharacterized protein n=1 Tax=Thalassospira marina TaxID=2048283 RepID=A0A2N3KUN0_9PROT|nr:hypothetical protein [Thalassospira marina]PKR54252.1 hypothetical protein COO20_08880 [Thalassospira marina]
MAAIITNNIDCAPVVRVNHAMPGAYSISILYGETRITVERTDAQSLVDVLTSALAYIDEHSQPEERKSA